MNVLYLAEVRHCKSQTWYNLKYYSTAVYRVLCQETVSLKVSFLFFFFLCFSEVVALNRTQIPVLSLSFLYYYIYLNIYDVENTSVWISLKVSNLWRIILIVLRCFGSNSYLFKSLHLVELSPFIQTRIDFIYYFFIKCTTNNVWILSPEYLIVL